ncbi:MAG TPA: response regulator [Thermoplasmatales archaeon]|nr:response regulator [Thermoplasmatales archaeon]
MAKVMVVDDETDLRNLVKLIMEKEGFEVETAENGADFLSKVDKFKPDLVLLDVMMPGLTTREILEKLKEKNTQPKIVLLTVVRYSDEEKEQLFKMENIVDYITKPFDVQKLVSAVSQHIAAA